MAHSKFITLPTGRSIATLMIAIGVAGCQTHGASADVTTAANVHGPNDKGDAMMEHQDKDHGPHLVATKSANDFPTTLSRLTAAVDARGLKTFAVIDHAKGAASIDEELRPTTLVIFGNPKGGTPLMQSAQTLGLALPLKALVYENSDGDIIIATTDIKHAVKEHRATDQATRATAIAGVLKGIAEEAAGS